jgi:small subunit ribosomal protein S16
MAVHIRLARHGAKKTPFYRIVVTDQRNPRDGRFIERLGTFNPASDAFACDRERLEYWRSKGAQPSDTLQSLLKKHRPEPETAAS